MEHADVFIGGRTGVRLLREAGTRIISVSQPCDHTDLATSVRNVTEMRDALASCPPWILELLHPDAPLDIVVQHGDARLRHPTAIEQCWSTGFPPGSFWRIAEHVLVPGPAMALALMAKELGDVELCMLAMEFCGGYAYDRRAQTGIIERDQLLRTVDLVRLGMMLERARGVERLRRISHWVLDGSRSPAESELALRLTLPQLRGGYHLPKPVLNPCIELTSSAARIAGQSRVFPDLYWSDARLDVEYDGEHWHQRQLAKDARRRDALAEHGISVISVTRQQKGSAHAFDPVARLIARSLGMRPPARDEGAFRKRRALTDEFSRLTWQGEACRTDVLDRRTTRGSA